MSVMQIVVNGELRQLPPATPLQGLIDQLALGERRVAVEINGQIIPRSRWAEQPLAEGDRVELIHAVGGG